MKTHHRIIQWLTLLALLIINLQPSTILAQGTAFTYQGRLNVNNQRVNGSYDLQFALYATDVNGSPVAGPVTNLATVITNGLFTTTVDFGPAVFDGTAYWLDIAVCTNGASTFTELTPRQQILPTPYAIFANTTSNLSGTLPVAQLPSSVVTNNQTGVSLGDITFSGNLTLPALTTTSGIIYAGGDLLLHGDDNQNFFAGVGAGNVTLTGSGNTGIGTFALAGDTSGSWNTANGESALYFNTIGTNNIALGYLAGYNITTGNNNIDIGNAGMAGDDSTIRIGDPAVHTATFIAGTINGDGGGVTNLNAAQLSGPVSLAQLPSSVVTNNETGVTLGNVTINGSFNLPPLTTTSNLIYAGNDLLLYNDASQNLFVGDSAGNEPLTGDGNTGIGASALSSVTSGSDNTANGFKALYSNMTGTSNIALGYLAGYNITTGNNNIDIGNQGTSSENNVIRIGGHQQATYVVGIYGSTASGGTAVYVSSSGQLGTTTSSRRFKQDIQPMSDASDVLLALHPVTFRYKPEIDPQGIPQFGLVAEEVAQVDPDLIVRGQDGQPYSVRYEQVNAMLLNEFLKEHRKVEAQNAQIQVLAQSVAELKAAVEKLNQKPEAP